jgi:hypothetical protein
MSDDVSGRPTRKIRDHIGLIQQQFQGLLEVMKDALGLIQRDAPFGPDNPPPDGRVLMTYDQIPGIAKQIIAHTLRIDALIQEAMETTLLCEEEDSILVSLKKESDEYKENVESLSEQNTEATIWIERMRSLLDVITTQTFGFYDNKSEGESSE